MTYGFSSLSPLTDCLRIFPSKHTEPARHAHRHRDIAHTRIKQISMRQADAEYLKKHPTVQAKTPKGMPSGSFGPTTAGRMDPYVDLFQEHGGSLIMLAKGNRSQQVTDACEKRTVPSVRSAVRRLCWPKIRSNRSKWSISRNWVWKPSARSTSKTSRPSSSWTTKATIFSRSSNTKRSAPAVIGATKRKRH